MIGQFYGYFVGCTVHPLMISVDFALTNILFLHGPNLAQKPLYLVGTVPNAANGHILKSQPV